MEAVKTNRSDGEDGFLLVAMIVAIFLILVVLSVAAPRVAMQMKREREVESAHRAKQYVRAIRMYYKKLGHYPGSMEQLKKSNNIRFLRQEYVDPLTGKSDWRLIRVGTNKTKVKGFFGEDLPGLPGGLGSAASMGSASSMSSFGSSTSGASGANGSMNTNAASGLNVTTSGTSGTSSGSGSAFGSGSSSGSGFGSSSGFGSGSSQGAGSLGGSAGPFMGVGSAKSGAAIVVVNEQTNYEDWEFLYDPRIEQMYAKASLLGGVNSGSSSGSLGSLGGSKSSGQGTGTGTSGTGTSLGGFGTTTPTTPTTPPQ